jgi:MFS family permease
VVVFLLAGLGWFHLLQFWHFVALALFFGVVDGFFLPASQALLPQLVNIEDLPSLNGLTTLSQRFCLFVGPLLGGALVLWAGPALAFTFDGLTFLFSAFCLLTIRLPEKGSPNERSDVASQRGRSDMMRNVVRDIREGFGYVRGERWLWISIVLKTISAMSLAASFGAAQPKLIRDVYGTGMWLLGLLVAMTSLGVILVTLCIGQFSGLQRRELFSNLSTLLLGCALIILGLPVIRMNPAVIASLVSVAYGFGMGFSGLIWSTVIQEQVPQEKLGRVSSIQMLCTMSLSMVGLALGGIMTDHVGASAVFVICGLLNIVQATIALSIRDLRLFA